MTVAEFMTDIKGRINNTSLPASKYLWALFEAIVNSIQSIEDSAIDDGYIEIYAQRASEEQLKWDIMNSQMDGEIIKPELAEFTTFTVSDNGIGFTQDNYKSFLTADSSFRINKGGKGIGRFLWLKAFEKARIESNFYENGKWYRREFDFSCDGVAPDDNLAESDSNNSKTTVVLEGYMDPYRSKCQKSLERIASKIIEHCLVYFLIGKCPQIVIRDSLGESINLNNHYEAIIRDSLHQDHFTLEDKRFVIYHVKMPEGAAAHELHLCANDREVRKVMLSKSFPNLQRKIADGTDTGFFYYGYLTGNYLDDNVNNSRIGFDFADEDNYELDNEITETKLVEAAKEHISAYLQEYIDEINIKKEKRIQNFVNYKKPQYRLLLNQRPDSIYNIKPDLSDKDLELALHEQVLNWDMEARQRGSDIKSNMAKNGIPNDEIMPRFEAYCKEVTAISKISLSEYVVRRKVILELLEIALEKQDDGTYKNEDQIHTIICPMRYTSNELNFDEMNLWIINDRLVYHNFLASDKQLRELPVIASDSQKRVDIAVFDEAFSFSDRENSFDSITIIEFKKPNRNDLDRRDTDPIDQVLGYVEDIKTGKKKKTNGRPFGHVQNTAFYCYVIADLTDSMKKSAMKATLTITPDGEGFFGYNPNYGTYIEVISYNKLLRDAQDRNRILFDKLFMASPREIIYENWVEPDAKKEEGGDGV